QKHLPKDGSLSLIDKTDEFSCQIFTGPVTRDILSGICDADLSLPWLSWQRTKISGRDVMLFRVSYAGELGWEIHTRNADTEAVYDAVMEAGSGHGLTPIGMFALNSLRLEKGYRTWKGDLSTDYTIMQSGLDRFINWSKPSFRGKAAIEREKQQGSSKRFVTLVVEAEECDAPYMSTLWHGDEVVGETTSGDWGHRVDKSIALGMVRTDLAVPGTSLEVEIFGNRVPAIVQADEPLWDAANERLRA
ncbi:MAG: aminomethyltransferase family protein, partial [Pseudomonadota bacterium]